MCQAGAPREKEDEGFGRDAGERQTESQPRAQGFFRRGLKSDPGEENV